MGFEIVREGIVMNDKPSKQLKRLDPEQMASILDRLVVEGLLEIFEDIQDIKERLEKLEQKG